MLSKLHIVEEMFEFVESQGIRYVVIGDYNFYLGTLQGDIDIIVDPDQLPSVKKNSIRSSGRRTTASCNCFNTSNRHGIWFVWQVAILGG